MAQITGTLYNDIADAYAAIQSSLSGIQTSARVALDAIVDVDTATYPQASTADADAALEIELALLAIFNNSYIAAGIIQNNNSSLLTAIKALNDFVITNILGDDPVTDKLTTWINVTMEGHWDGVYCPQGWANMSSDAGYDISGWNTE